MHTHPAGGLPIYGGSCVASICRLLPDLMSKQSYLVSHPTT